jgi:hypothetical protein
VDFPGDLDYFVIDLDAGETVHLRLESAMIDSYLAVDYVGAGEEQIVEDDDSGGGIFGVDAGLTYRAPQDGRYRVIVADLTGVHFGGYLMRVEQPGADAPTPSAPRPTATPIVGPNGELMAQYTSDRYPLAMQYPARCEALGAQPDMGVVAAFDCENANLTISETDLSAAFGSGATVAELADLMVATLQSISEDFQLVARRRLTTDAGLEAIVLEYTLNSGAIRGATLVYVHDGTIGFSAAWASLAQDNADLKAEFDYAFSTLQVTGGA